MRVHGSSPRRTRSIAGAYPARQSSANAGQSCSQPVGAAELFEFANDAGAPVDDGAEYVERQCPRTRLRLQHDLAEHAAVGQALQCRPALRERKPHRRRRPQPGLDQFADSELEHRLGARACG